MEATDTAPGNGETNWADAAAASGALQREVRRYTKHLPVTLTEHEKAGLADEIAELSNEEEALRERRSALTKAINKKQAAIREVVAKIDAGTEHRPVEVVDYAVDASNQIVTVRQDVLEQVNARAMTHAEMQGEFAFEEGEDDPLAADDVAKSVGNDSEADDSDDSDDVLDDDLSEDDE